MDPHVAAAAAPSCTCRSGLPRLQATGRGDRDVLPLREAQAQPPATGIGPGHRSLWHAAAPEVPHWHPQRPVKYHSMMYLT